MTAPPEPLRNRRGAEVRDRLLGAALEVFAAAGYRAATTREIAARAGVNLPAIPYYFGGKEGLYLACARTIVARYEASLGAQTAAITAALPSMGADEARAQLKQVLAAVAELLVADRDAERWTAFARREIAEPGPAFDLLNSQLWSPGIAFAAALVERTGASDATLEAVLLISGLATLTFTRPVAFAQLGWDVVTAERLAAINRVTARRIDALG